MTYKSPAAHKVLCLLDGDEDAPSRYREFVDLVASEHQISVAQLENDLEPFI